MKKLTLILLALCLTLSVFAVACTPNNTDDTTTPPDVGEVTDTRGGDDVQGGEDTKAPDAADTEKDNEDEGFISISPADSDDKWGNINVAP